MLNRGIGKWDLVLLIINCVIGAGIFGLPSRIFKLSGAYSIFAVLACAAVVSIFIFVFAEVSSRFDKTGGPYLYIHEAFGPIPAFFGWWLLVLARVFNYSTLINLLVVYLSFFSESFKDPAIRIAVILLFTFLLCYLNHIGVRNSTRINNILTIGKLVPLSLFIIAGLFFLQPAHFNFSTAPSLPSFTNSVLLLIFAFGGFETALINAGEIVEPKKNLPFALLLSALVVAVFYCLIQVVSIGNLSSLASSEKPLADAAINMIGTTGGFIITIGAAISITGTLNALMMSASRLPYALSNEKQFPPFFSYVHPKYLTPTWSLLLMTVVISIVSIAWGFISSLNIGVIFRLILYCFICAALIRLRKKSTTKDYYKVRIGVPLAIAGFIFSFILLTTSKWNEIRDFLFWILAGLVLFGLVRLFMKKQR